MSSVLTFLVFSTLLLNLIPSSEESVKISSQLLDQNAVDGNRKKFIINLKDDEKSSGSPIMDQIGRRFRRYLKSETESAKIKSYTKAFNDIHFVAEVHWSGTNSSSIMVLMKDPDSIISPTRPSHFYVSRDYGKTYTNITNNFKLSNGSIAVISDFVSSKSDHRKYILMAKFHRKLFISSDECKSFSTVSTFFYPSEIKYHPHFSYYVAAHEKKMGSKRLYTSTNNGRSWRFKSSDVEAYAWSYYQPFDRSSYIYYHKDNSYAHGVVLKTRAWSYYYSRTVASNVNDFQLINQYMFITKNGTIPGTQDLYISVNRRSFHKAIFPFTNNTKYDKKSMSFLIADASENETMVAVSHGNSTANLYISDTEGKRFSLSLESILYFNQDDKSSARKYFRHDFVDLHRVVGVSGVYIATNLTKGKPGTRHLQSWITFDKGGTWSYIEPPRGECPTGANATCALHLSQEYGYHNPYTRFSPIYSRESAPGFILATGNVGVSLRASANVYLSTDAGLTWKKVLDGHFHYAFVDHGGVIVGVKKYGYVNMLYYSWDEGHTWYRYKFSKDLVRVYGLLTEPGEKSTTFTLFASKSGGHSWVVLQVNFNDFLGRPCTDKDYYLWELTDQRNDSEHCSLGKKQKFERRLPDAKCINGYDYDRAVSSENCLCAREDYMCDFGFREFILGWFGKFCLPDINFANYTVQAPSWCRPGLLYNVSSGYRKVPGDTCQGGALEKSFMPETRACKIPEISEFVLYSKTTYIVRYDTARRTSIRINLNGMRNVISLDYDYKGNTLFYADVTMDRIIRLNMSTGHLHEVIQFDESRVHVEGIAYDWLNKNIYYTDVGSAEIGMVSIDGRFKKTLFGPSTVAKPRGIAVHPVKGYIFWTDIGRQRISRADMNGKNFTDIVTTNLRTPNDVAIDYKDNYIYWTDSGMDRIERSDFNGNNRKVIQSYGVNNPYSLDILKDRLFWDDWSYGGIQSINKNTGSSKHSHINWLYKPAALRAFWDGKQDQNGNPCAGKTCPLKCVPAGGSYACICPDGLNMASGGQCTCPGNEIYDRRTGDCKPRSNETCSNLQFTCKITGECIPAHWKCDGDKDCSDGTDELDCSATKKCRSDQFQCDDGACISGDWKCDGDNDCSDHSDEKNCKASTCAPNHVRCPTSECINKNWVCDGMADCDDGWDEKNCHNTTTTPSITPTTASCPSGQFRCRSSGFSRCFPTSYKCDGSNDCDDGSDEKNCHKVTCTKDEWRCTSGLQCIPQKKRCNNFEDCVDGSDEKNCYLTPTPVGPTKKNVCDPGTKPCDGGRRCYSKAERCNGEFDCNDRADELNCPKVTTTPKACPHRCKGSTKCIGIHQLCDGFNDCPNKDDEDPKICGSCSFRCNNGKCGQRCDGKTDCPNGEDERGCSCPLPEPFVHKCLGACINITKMCDRQSDCDDSSDEPTDCQKTNRVENFNIKQQTRVGSITLSWKMPKIDAPLQSIRDYKIHYMSLVDKIVHDISIPFSISTTQYDIHGLEKCTKYIIAIGLDLSILKNKPLYVEKTIEIGGFHDPTNGFQVLANQKLIAWKEESGLCVKKFIESSRRLRCLKKPIRQFIDFILYDVDVSLHDKGSISDPYTLFPNGKMDNNTYRCFIAIGYQGTIIKSIDFDYTPSAAPSTGGHSGDGKKKKNTLMWAIPVALVVLALFLGLAVMVYKYRRLQHSFLAFAARGNYTRQEDDLDDDDGDMVVGFHTGEDTPMINRFSDDEPLVVA